MERERVGRSIIDKNSNPSGLFASGQGPREIATPSVAVAISGSKDSMLCLLRDAPTVDFLRKAFGIR